MPEGVKDCEFRVDRVKGGRYDLNIGVKYRCQACLTSLTYPFRRARLIFEA